jgi:hypothetical protein
LPAYRGPKRRNIRGAPATAIYIHNTPRPKDCTSLTETKARELRRRAARNDLGQTVRHRGGSWAGPKVSVSASEAQAHECWLLQYITYNINIHTGQKDCTRVLVSLAEARELRRRSARTTEWYGIEAVLGRSRGGVREKELKGSPGGSHEERPRTHWR